MQTVSLILFSLRLVQLLGSPTPIVNGSFAQLLGSSGRGTLGAGPAIMVTSGITSPTELCLVVENGAVDAEGADVAVTPCVSAIAAGDGRELFSLQPNGQLVSIAGKMCVGLLENDVADGGRIVTMRCDEAAKSSDGRGSFEMQGNGQVKLGRDGQYCLTLRGSGPGRVNVALRAAASASSTADAFAHGAGMMTDARSHTYWASKPDETNQPVELSVDFGSAAKIESAEIAWEFPAKAFSLFLSNGGSVWEEAFSTDINGLGATRVPLGFKVATKAKLVLRQPHPVYGRFNGHSLFGIRSLSFAASGLQTVVEECAKASQSGDARDKFFLSSVSQLDPSFSKALRGEVPAFEAAKASLAATTAELSDVLPRISACGSEASFLLRRPSSQPTAFPIEGTRPQDSSAVTSLKVESRKQGAQDSIAKVAAAVEDQNGIDLESANLLMHEARAAVLLARAALK